MLLINCMKLFFSILFVLCFFSANSQLPLFKNEALASMSSETVSSSDKKPYIVVLYGSLNCGYTNYLLQHIDYFTNCTQMELILLLNNSKDAIKSRLPDLINRYTIYSNDVLQHQFKTNNDIVPQLFVFKGEEQVLHFKGVKKDMFKKAKQETGCAVD